MAEENPEVQKLRLTLEDYPESNTCGRRKHNMPVFEPQDVLFQERYRSSTSLKYWQHFDRG